MVVILIYSSVFGNKRIHVLTYIVGQLPIESMGTLVNLLWMQNYWLLLLPLSKLRRSLLNALFSICGVAAGFQVHLNHGGLQKFVHRLCAGVFDQIIHFTIHLVADTVPVLG